MQPLYLDRTRPVEERIDDLMRRMTLEEKVGLLNMPCVYVDQLGKDIPSKTAACKRFAEGTYTVTLVQAEAFLPWRTRS